MTEQVRPWSTQPITGAQHRQWLAEERRSGMTHIKVERESTQCLMCGEWDTSHTHRLEPVQDRLA